MEITKSNQGNKNAGRKECWENGIRLLPAVSFLPSFLREDDEEEKKKRGGGNESGGAEEEEEEGKSVSRRRMRRGGGIRLA